MDESGDGPGGVPPPLLSPRPAEVFGPTRRQGRRLRVISGAGVVVEDDGSGKKVR
jgi:hypothetical protein